MRLTIKEKEYLMKKSPILWIEENKIKNEQGLPLNFHNHLFQYDMYLDMSPKQAIQKPAQVGESTKYIIKAQHVAYYQGMDIIYTLPTANDVKEFVGGKVNRIIANNPVLSEWTKDKDSIEQKRVGDRAIYFKGTWTEKAATMVTSDLNIYDEVDASKQDIIEQYSTRLQHSRFGWEWWFSHPSQVGRGINKIFEKSDQKHWFQKCSRCNFEWYLEWPNCIDMERKCFICKNCKQPFREEDRRKGRWVKRFQNREISGYQVSSLFCPWISAEKIIGYYQDKSEEYFYNKVLGLPYVGAGTTVTEDTIYKNCLEIKYDAKKRIIIGCDTGLTQYYVVGSKEGLWFYGKSEGYDEVEALLKKFTNAILVMDAKGDLVKPRELQKKYPGRVLLCEYRQDRKTLQLVQFGKHKEHGSVVVDRNRMIQYIIEEFDRKEIVLFGSDEKWNEYLEHWSNIYREEEMDALDMPRRVWKRNGADHWVHATVYWRAGMSKYAEEGSVLSSQSELTNLTGVHQGVNVIDGHVMIHSTGKEWKIY